MPDYSHEMRLRAERSGPVAGVDEAGRGPLAGPVVAAAVILDVTCIPDGLNDSKKLTAKARDEAFERIIACALIGIGMASVEEIDRLNIRRANHLAMVRAVNALAEIPAFVLIDGNDAPPLSCPCDTLIGGDGLSVSIAAASIIAKVTRDRLMVELDAEHPHYLWRNNKGYGTADHLTAMKNFGVTPHHRKSFAPVYQMLCPVNHGDSILTA
ncbi:MAG: hypothetical protein RJB62_1620 [Pseudomonadota bacterium]|jgi:ribonuclease HII